LLSQLRVAVVRSEKLVAEAGDYGNQEEEEHSQLNTVASKD
jgi:hypothetical protein